MLKHVDSPKKEKQTEKGYISSLSHFKEPEWLNALKPKNDKKAEKAQEKKDKNAEEKKPEEKKPEGS